MTDYQLFCVTILVFAALRISIMTRATAMIAASLGDRSMTANALRNGLALQCVRQVYLFTRDIEMTFRRLAN